MVEADSYRFAAHVKIIPPWEVFNEALGSLLCQWAGLLTPRSYLALVQREDYPDARFFTETKAAQALAFATETMPFGSVTRYMSVTATQALRELLTQWYGWPDALVFDQWIANPDRHSGNLLVGSPGEIYLIDHGLSFLRRNWPPEQAVAAQSIVTARLWTEILAKVVTLPQRVEATARLYATAARYALIDVATVIVASKVSGFLPETNVAALLEFLTYRVQCAASVLCGVMGVPTLDLGDTP